MKCLAEFPFSISKHFFDPWFSNNFNFCVLLNMRSYSFQHVCLNQLVLPSLTPQAPAFLVQWLPPVCHGEAYVTFETC